MVRYSQRKLTVEECLSISAGMLQRCGAISLGVVKAGFLRWPGQWGGTADAAVVFEVDATNPAKAGIRFEYRRILANGDYDDVAIDVDLKTTRLPWGGLRWWFCCPSPRYGHYCERRCDKLYLPPGGQQFGCRLCHDLTYKSSQQAHKYDRLHAYI